MDFLCIYFFQIRIHIYDVFSYIMLYKCIIIFVYLAIIEIKDLLQGACYSHTRRHIRCVLLKNMNNSDRN